MKKTYWFKAKKYGWGWKPVTWQGWSIILFFSAVIVVNFYRIDSHSHSVSDTLISFVPQTLFIIAIMVLIAYRTGEKPHWSWGDKQK